MPRIRIESGRGSNDLRISVRDQISGTTLAQFTLTAEQYFTMAGGGHVDLDGKISEHLDRVGKSEEVEVVHYGHDDLRASTYDGMLADAEQMARADRPGWDTYSSRRGGGGSTRITVTLRRWR
jgi:hypothetical protein